MIESEQSRLPFIHSDGASAVTFFSRLFLRAVWFGALTVDVSGEPIKQHASAPHEGQKER
jgi:hypothetical protein